MSTYLTVAVLVTRIKWKTKAKEQYWNKTSSQSDSFSQDKIRKLSSSAMAVLFQVSNWKNQPTFKCLDLHSQFHMMSTQYRKSANFLPHSKACIRLYWNPGSSNQPDCLGLWVPVCCARALGGRAWGHPEKRQDSSCSSLFQLFSTWSSWQQSSS